MLTSNRDCACLSPAVGAANGIAGSASASSAGARVLVAQLGARRHYAVPRALWRAGLLERLVTDFCSDVGRWPVLRQLAAGRRSPAGLRRMMERTAGEIPGERIATLPGFAFNPRLRRRGDETATDFWARRNAAFCEAVIRTGFGAADCIYAFNGAALEIFEAAKARGLATILDQTAAPWRWNAALLRCEADRWPGWEALPAELDASGHLSAREEAEWRLADLILVGSEFARAALAEASGPAERTAILAYPVPATRQRGSVTEAFKGAFSGARKLRVLFVGTLQLRKGIQYLYEAAGLLKDEPVEFLAVGPSHLSADATTLLAERLRLVGRVPRSEVGRYYDWADVLVLPTLSEGSANVCWEATAHGRAVITTLNAGVPAEAVDSGCLVPPQDAGALAAALRKLLASKANRAYLRPHIEAAGQADAFAAYALELSQLVRQAAAGPAPLAAAGIRSFG